MKIALIAPSGKIDRNDFEKSLLYLQDAGIEYIYSQAIFKSEYTCAGSAEERAFDLVSYLNNPHITHIWCLKGGYGSMELYALLQGIQWQKLPKKTIIGFSDNCFLMTGLKLMFPQFKIIHRHTLLFKPLLESFEKKNSTLDTYLKATLSPFRVSFLASDVFNAPQTTSISGLSFVGNLTMATYLMGTEWEVHLAQKIVFLEDWNESFYQLKRYIQHLMNTAHLQKSKCIILGSFINCMKSIEENDWWRQFWEEFSLIHQIPIIFNFKFGHQLESEAIPLLEKITVHFDRLEIYSS